MSYPGPTPPSPLEHRNSMVFQPEDLSLNYAEMRTIPPVPLWMLLSAEKETSQQMGEEKSVLCVKPFFDRKSHLTVICQRI